jgi:hypothetical protein
MVDVGPRGGVDMYMRVQAREVATGGYRKENERLA